MKNSFLELLVVGERLYQKFVAAAGETIVIGRSAECQIVIDEPSIAARHARLTWLADGEGTIEPAGPLDPAGLRVNDQPVTVPVKVHQGDKISLGHTTLVWRWLEKEECPTIASRGPDATQSVVAELVAEIKKGRYQSGAELGRGGMGKVLEALEKPLQRPVALKVLLRPGEEENQRRFIREARITGALQHPSIVPVHELNVDEKGRVFYTMKLVKGVTLLKILQDLAAREPEAIQRYSLPALLTIFQKVCDAVAFAHEQTHPVIHRDLKPENIMVGDFGEVLVMDWGAAKILRDNETIGNSSTVPQGATACSRSFFGVSKAPAAPVQPNESNRDLEGIRDAETNEAAADLSLTQPGSMMGTPGYMAPEQARGHAAAADERTDIYALGAILYALVTLEAPVRLTVLEAETYEARRSRGEDVTRAFLQHAAPLLSERLPANKLQHLGGARILTH